MARSAIVQDGNAWMQFSERWQNALESIELPSWACSSVGRAPALQAGGRGFESPHVHQSIQQLSGNDSLQLVNRIRSSLATASREESGRVPEENGLALMDCLRGLIADSPDLTDRERGILRASYLEGRPVPEIAREVGRSTGTVSTDSARAVRKLRRVMRDMGFRGALPESAPVMGSVTGRPPRRHKPRSPGAPYLGRSYGSLRLLAARLNFFLLICAV